LKNYIIEKWNDVKLYEEVTGEKLNIFGKIIIFFGFVKREHIVEQKDCYSCAKQHTMKCPNSSKCYSLDDKPYWEPNK
jgi:hypothetical protein